MTEKKKTPTWVWVLLAIVGLPLATCVGLAAVGGAAVAGTEVAKSSGKAMLEDIEDQVAVDAVKQYEIAKREGGKMEMCSAAGMVSAAFLQAKDEPNYKKWKETERADCKAAGMPDMQDLQNLQAPPSP